MVPPTVCIELGEETTSELWARAIVDGPAVSAAIVTRTTTTRTSRFDHRFGVAPSGTGQSLVTR